MDGVINIYKEQGFTSHDVVAKMRGMLHMKKIGHTGTLDPDATGVLPVCLGKATKLCGMITDWKKTYEAVMLLGTVTDTQDISGQVIARSEVNVNEADVVSAINSFAGEYSQIPPMYSALKHNGKKLYELARAGVEIEREPRNVNISFIHVNEIDLSERNVVKFTVECSKGTYIRTLCDDIGKKLGCGACMESLKRIRVGQFSIDESITLGELDKMIKEERVSECFIPIDDMFAQYSKINVKEESDLLVHNGNKFAIDDIIEIEDMQLLDLELFRIYDSCGIFIGIYQLVENVFIPVKMFYSGQIM